MELLSYLSSHFLLLDGGTGTVLQKMGLAPGERTEAWNLSHPDRVTSLHRAYYDAGSNLVCTNTFGVNGLRYTAAEAETLISAAVACAREAARTSEGTQPKWVALDIGPVGQLLSPAGTLSFEDAVEAFAVSVRAGVKAGADAVVIETLTDSYETKAALLAAKENAALPVFVTNAYGEDGRLMTGADPEGMAALLEGMGAHALGVNCSSGPSQLLPVVKRLLAASSSPVIFKPNAGLPRVENGETVYDVSVEDFAASVREAATCGVRIAGGCCGTTPAHIRAVRDALSDLSPLPVTEKTETVVSSFSRTVTFSAPPVVIGERINPTGKKRLRQALTEGDLPYVLSLGAEQEEAGAQVLDVNVGVAGLNEKELLPAVIAALQGVTGLPLQIDTSDPGAMEAALRLYNGKPLLNSVNGRRESMEAVFPLAKKYGGVVVALTLDENGIPDTAEGRVRIAEKILKTARTFGIAEKNLVFDPLALTVSADPAAPSVTLEAVKRISALGCRTVLGVSNVSFGLPRRDTVNAVFLTAALSAGLSAAILNPSSAELRAAVAAYRALTGRDAGCAEYIALASSLPAQTPAGTVQTVSPASPEPASTPLQKAIRRGLKQDAAKETEAALRDASPLAVIDREIIPALDRVGQDYAKGTVFLPGLLAAASAAGAAFDLLRARSAERTDAAPKKRGRIVLATVEGDVHDIGKNIVRLLLENYGFDVNDLGKDVPPAAVCEAAKEEGVLLVGLSALMTTTVPSMERTVALLHRTLPSVPVVVGGAVLRPDLAAKIGADHYAKDAMDTVRLAQSLSVSIYG